MHQLINTSCSNTHVQKPPWLNTIEFHLLFTQQSYKGIQQVVFYEKFSRDGGSFNTVLHSILKGLRFLFALPLTSD